MLSWFVVTSGVALMPFTAGVSVAITFIGQAAMYASVAQCVIGLGRTSAELVAPQALDRLDQEDWYQAATAALDGIALLGVTTSALSTIKAINVSTRVTGKPLRQVLKGLTRQERAKLNDELLRINDPRLTTKILKLKQAAGTASKRISAIEMQQVIATHKQDAAAGILGVVSSTISGNMNPLAVGIYEEVRQ